MSEERTMAQQCVVCGHQGALGANCPRCGSPLAPAAPGVADDRTVSAPKPAAAPDGSIFRAPVSERSPADRPAPRVVDAAGNPSRSTTGRRGLSVAVIAVAAVLALVGGGALALPYLGSAVPAGLRPEDARVPLVVHGSPATRSAWQAGYRESWRLNPDRRVEEGDPGSGAGSAGYAGRTEDVVAFTSDTATASGSLLTVSAVTGRTVRQKYSQESCGGLVKGGLLHCQGGRMGYYPTDLEDLATGESRTIATSQELGAEIEDGREDAYGWTTYVVGGVLFASWTTESSEDGDPQHGNIARIAPAGTSFSWRTEYPWHGTDHDGRIQHGILTDRSFAVDVETGELLATAGEAGGAVQWVAADVLQDGGDSTTPRALTAPDGTTVTVIGRGALPVTTQALPRHPLRQLGGRLEAFEPATGADAAAGQAVWSSDLGLTTTGSEGGDLVAAYHDGLIAVAQVGTPARAAVPVILLSEATGAVLWRTTVGRPSPGGATWEALPTFTADGSVLVQTVSRADESEWYQLAGARMSLLDAATSRTLWSRKGIVAGYPKPVFFTGSLAAAWSAGVPLSTDLEDFTAIVADNLDGTWSMLAPRSAGETATPPAGAPACPDGMSAVSWTQYEGGAILLCRQDSAFAVVFPAHPDWWANQLTFTGGGYAIVFSNRVVVRATLGGALILLDDNGSVSSHPATSTWDATLGRVEALAASDIRTCPAGSWPISLSTFDGGWLLVCGTASDQPSRLILSDRGTVGDTGAVTGRPGAYCGTIDNAEVCAYRAPAVVTIALPGEPVTQHSVQRNYYDGYGPGGQGEGTGSYGVDVPESTAKDQVRYLTQILQKSMVGRSSINRAVAEVRGCTRLDDAVATVAGVVANREELLTALDSAPVDAVPDGGELLAKLRTALQLSHDSDLVWEQWAQSEQSNGCAEGETSPLYRQVIQMNVQVSAAKDDFVNVWNSRISSAYAAPEFRRSQI